jgi:hypothetical protein
MRWIWLIRAVVMWCNCVCRSTHAVRIARMYRSSYSTNGETHLHGAKRLIGSNAPDKSSGRALWATREKL